MSTIQTYCHGSGIDLWWRKQDDAGTVLSSCTTVITSNRDPWIESARTAVEALVDAAETEHRDRLDVLSFWAFISAGIFRLARARPIGQEEARALATDPLSMEANGVIQGPLTERAADLVILVLNRRSLDLMPDILEVRGMLRQTIRDREQQEGPPPAPNDDVGENEDLSSMAADGREHAVAGAPLGDNAVAGDLESVANCSIGGGRETSVPSIDMPSNFSAPRSVVGRNEASGEINNLVVPPAGNHTLNEDSPEAATRGDGDHSRVRSRGEEESGSGHAGTPDGKRKRTD